MTRHQFGNIIVTMTAYTPYRMSPTANLNKATTVWFWVDSAIFLLTASSVRNAFT